MIQTILFDLDGTLLPMDQDEFTRAYLGLLCRTFAPFGYEPKLLTTAVWKGLEAMVKNTSSLTNEAVFWNEFEARMGRPVTGEERQRFDRFYSTDFHRAAAVCHPTPAAGELVQALKNKGLQVVLATLPAFPLTAIRSRLSWAGIDPEWFDHITSYENCTRCKPDPAYYREILTTLSLRPEECLMIGNNVDEDMIACTLGITGFLMTPCLINEHGADISAYLQGDFEELQAYLQSRELL